MDGGITDGCYKQMKPEEKPNEQSRGKVLIKFVKETCNTVVIVQHPGEEPYMEASHINDEGAALKDIPQAKKAPTMEPLVEGIVQDVFDSDSDEAK